MQDVFILSEDDYETDMYMITQEIYFSNQRFSNYQEHVKLQVTNQELKYEKLCITANKLGFGFIETDLQYFQDVMN